MRMNNNLWLNLPFFRTLNKVNCSRVELEWAKGSRLMKRLLLSVLTFSLTFSLTDLTGVNKQKICSTKVRPRKETFEVHP